MPPPAVLRKRHTLTGKDIFPLIKRVRGAEGPAGPLARLKMNTPTETMTKSVQKRMSPSLLCPFGDVRASSMLPERHEVKFNNKGSLWINKGTLILKWVIYTNFH